MPGQPSSSEEPSNILGLRHTSAETGRTHVTELAYQVFGDHYVVDGGEDDAPEWLTDLMAGTPAEVELGGASFAVTARVAEGSERDKLRAWRLAHPVLGRRLAAAERQGRTGVPIVVLSRADTYAFKRQLNQEVIAEFRANGGKVNRRVGDFSFAGVPLLLLHHRGRTSGQERINPLQYGRYRNGFVVFATNGGSPWHPHWYRNLMADPVTTIEVGTETIAVVAHDLDGPERERFLYGSPVERLLRRNRFGGYQNLIGREVPVVYLERATANDDDQPRSRTSVSDGS